MLNSNNRIAFRTHISTSIGLGHFSRLQNLEHSFKNQVEWILSGDLKIIKKLFKKRKYIFFKNSKNLESKISKFLINKKIHKVVIDLSHNEIIKNNKIVKLQKIYMDKGIKLISFDDARHKIVSHYSIIGTISSSKKLKKTNSNKKIFIGRDYNFLHYALKKKENKFKFKKNASRILISISGTDKNSTGLKILRLLANLDYKFTLINGKKIDLSKKNNLILKKNFSKLKILSLVSKSQMIKEIEKADLGICGPGIIKFDLSMQKKPFIMILDKNTKKNIQMVDFLKFKNCEHLVINKRTTNEKLYNSILRYISNFNLRKKHFLNSKKFFNLNVMKKKQETLIGKIKKLG